MALVFNERFIRMGDGVSVHVRDYPAGGSASRLPVMCVHGLTRNSADFEEVAPTIATLGRRVLAIDVRGRGKSDRDPDPTRYRPDVYVNDVIAVMDALKAEKAVFIGTSMGGLITMMLSVMAPDRVSAAILNDVGPVVNPVGLARIASYVARTAIYDSWDTAIAAISDTQGPNFPRADRSFWVTFARRTATERADGKIVLNMDPEIGRGFAQPAPATPPPDLKPFFAGLRDKPVLVVRGTISDILAPEGVGAMREIKPDLEYVEVPNVGHAPTLEEHEAREAISRFLAGIP